VLDSFFEEVQMAKDLAYDECVSGSEATLKGLSEQPRCLGEWRA